MVSRRQNANKNATEQVGLKMAKPLKADLQDLADADRRPLATYIKLVLEDHVAEKKRQKKR